MSAYTIAVMVRHPGQITPDLVEIRNVKESVEKLLGGEVHTGAYDFPVSGVVMVVGPSGMEGSVMFARDGGNHWEGLGFEDQKRIMAWHLKGGGRLDPASLDARGSRS